VGQKAIVLNPENKILVPQRSEKSGLAGKWSFPGGALEQGEDPLVSIQREIIEETQLIVNELKPFHVKSYLSDDGDFVVIIGYVCVLQTGKVVLNWEHDDFKWLSKKEVLEMNLTNDGRTFIESFDNSQSC
jgi:8-oxo-dGTP diphosphatase